MSGENVYDEELQVATKGDETSNIQLKKVWPCERHNTYTLLQQIDGLARWKAREEAGFEIDPIVCSMTPSWDVLYIKL